ncbi:MAG: glycosyltransferase family 39 protein [Candidatus Hydrogenedentes bacterium]|nr:glycosyltransferase family 39 protein [Candidatus Hydrogenedentota bacterium]
MIITFLIAAGGASIVLRLLRLPNTWESWTGALLTGYCFASAVILAIGSFNIRAACSIWITLAAISMIGFALPKTKRLSLPQIDLSAQSFSGLDKISLLAIFMAFLSGVLVSFAPVTSWDAGVAHLALPAAYWREERIAAMPLDNYSLYPQLMHTLFAIAPPGLRESHASGTVLFMSLALCSSTFWLARRIAGPACGLPAAAMIATTPLFLEHHAVPEIDIPYTATVVAALSALAAWRQEKNYGWLVLAGLLAGSGCGIRHTAYLAGALMLTGVFFVARERRWYSASVFAAVASASAAPWLLRTALICGNPVYPFFTSILGANAAPDIDVAAIGAHSSIQGSHFAQLISFPWSLAMNPKHYGGWDTSPGVLWLVLGVLGIAAGGRGARMLGAFGGAGLVAIFFFQRFARYAFPFIAPLFAVAAVPLETLPRLRRAVGMAMIVSYAFGLGPSMAVMASKLPVVFGLQSRDAYLAARIERYPAMLWVSQNLADDARILSLDPRGYYFDRRTVTNFEALKSISGLDYAGQREWLRKNGVTHLFYSEQYRQSPAFRATRVGAMIDGWRADTEHFAIIKQFDLPNPRVGGTERVEIYEFKP